MSVPTPTPLPPGLLILQGNRLEWLLDALLDWLGAHPLAPLETETLLVQSNGIAEWLKMSLAQRSGVCAATRVELPARFLWRLYRGVLGREGAPARSPLDEAPLTWRLMQRLPQLAGQPGYEPLAQFLAADDRFGSGEGSGGGPAALPRRLQLARRLADLYDQYQVYRADWLHAWMRGDEVLIGPAGQRSPLPPEQRWQARLWRELVEGLGEGLDAAGRTGVRGEVHKRAVARLEAGEEAGEAPVLPLPRRVVVFGVSHLPQQTLEALAALGRHAQVLLAVPNPCRYHWADVIEGRELLGRPRGLRQPHRGGVDLAQLPLEAAHAQAQPLLAAWGRQARDFLRLLDQVDETQAMAQALAIPRVDLFDEGPGETRLAQLQARIRDNLPNAEALEDAPKLAAGDRSIVFHVAHSAMREVEILHDQLLALLHGPVEEGAATLAPRDIVVMLPDIEPWAPLIHAVFGRFGAGDARRIPYEITDLRARSQAPLLRALEWLLRVDEQRCTASELRDLLEVPALARRFGLDEKVDGGRAIAARWLAGAGVRWGLHAAQRERLGLGACGEANSWRFGLRRMLLGYAAGRTDEGAENDDGGPAPAAPDWQGIAAYDEVGGLDAVVAGSLAALLDALEHWWALSGEPAAPAVWGERGRALLEAFFEPADEADRLRLGTLVEALARWQEDCDAAGYAEALPLAVLRDAWLAGVDEPALRSRFLSGGVVFCTLMPMRAIPFEVVCLLGMNDGDYPRRSPRSDFDLIGSPGQQRPGDRARRDDDRLLMLEALLAARRVFYVSWAGRSLRDQSEQPASVLVAQLRDAIAGVWGDEALAAITTEHPLQPFSRRYFQGDVAAEGSPDSSLFTYAGEWRQAHELPDRPAADATALPDGVPSGDARQAGPLDLKRLSAWLRRPVETHWRERLGVVFTPLEAALADDEPLGLDALEQTLLLQDLVADAASAARPPAAPSQDALQERLLRRIDRLARRGELPLGAMGRRWQAQFLAQAQPMLAQWQRWQAEFAQPLTPQRVQWPLKAATDATARVTTDAADPPWLEDWLDGLRQGADPAAPPAWLQLDARRLTQEVKKVRVALPDKLLGPWLRLCVAAASGQALQGRLVGRDAALTLHAPQAATAREVLTRLHFAWRQGQRAPLPVAMRSAMAWLGEDSEDEAAAAAQRVYDGAPPQGRGEGGEGQEAPLARLWPEWESLAEAPSPRAEWPAALTDAGADAVRDYGEQALAPGFAAWAELLYAPLRDWAADHVEITALPTALGLDQDTGEGA